MLTSVVCIFNGSGWPGCAIVGFPNSFVVIYKTFHSQEPILLPPLFPEGRPGTSPSGAGIPRSQL